MSAHRTAGFNFLEQQELPAPQVTEAQAEDLVATHYGLSARVTSLGSQQDRNFVVGADGGGDGVAGVLKIANPAFTEQEIAAQDAAAQLIADAEGAKHDIAIEIRTAASESDALTVARAIARNNLFKCAIFGDDPNWGRIVAAVGTTDAVFEPQQLDVSVNGVQVCRACGVGDDRSLVDLSGREVHVVVDLHAGSETATVWTNDLTHDYVHENSAYST